MPHIKGLVVGGMYVWHPEMVKGLDGVVYSVYGLHASGRGWVGRRYYTPAAPPVKEPFIVRVLPERHCSNYKKSYAFVELVRGYDVAMLSFSKKPYVRRDGTYTITSQNVLDDKGLAYAYGALRTTEQLWDKYDDGSSFMLDWYPECVAMFEEKSMHYLMDIAVARKQLERCDDFGKAI